MSKQLLKAVGGFLILLLLYHAAKYMILFKDNAPGFFVFQLLFIIAAWFIAKWQAKKGLSAWGLDGRQSLFKHLGAGILMGIILYGLYFFISLINGSERIVSVSSITQSAGPLFLFSFSSFYSSISEDILTRGYVYHHLHKKISTHRLIIISAVLFSLNHIYRLKSAEAILYLFVLGVLLMIPLVLTKRLWYTSGIHWAGNMFFYFTHEVIKTETLPDRISSNYILFFCILLVIPLNYLILKWFDLIPINRHYMQTSWK